MKKVYLLIHDGGWAAGYFVDAVLATRELAEERKSILIDNTEDKDILPDNYYSILEKDVDDKA